MKKIFVMLLAACTLVGCQQKKEELLNIAVIFPLTGNTGAAMANNVKNALIMCVDSINEAGGINGQIIDMDFYDCRNADPKEGVVIANRLIATNPPKIVITMISGVVLNTSPIFEKYKILNLAICSSSNLFSSPKEYTLRTHISSNQTGYAIAKAIVNDFGRNNVKVLYANTEFGHSSLESFEKAANEIGLVYSTIPFEEKELSYRNYILKADLQSNDLLYAIGIQESLGKLIRECRTLGFNGQIIGGPDLISFLALENMGNQRQNIFYTKTSRGEKFNDFNNRYISMYGEPMDEIAVLCCNGFLTVMDCLQEIGSNDIDKLMQQIKMYQSNSLMGTTSFVDNDMIFDFEITKLEE